ncbi:hypothetical protein BV25DRAFT_1885323, partial [Artomyces pyxidatus]
RDDHLHAHLGPDVLARVRVALRVGDRPRVARLLGARRVVPRCVPTLPHYQRRALQRRRRTRRRRCPWRDVRALDVPARALSKLFIHFYWLPWLRAVLRFARVGIKVPAPRISLLSQRPPPRAGRRLGDVFVSRISITLFIVPLHSSCVHTFAFNTGRAPWRLLS